MSLNEQTKESSGIIEEDAAEDGDPTDPGVRDECARKETSEQAVRLGQTGSRVKSRPQPPCQPTQTHTEKAAELQRL